MCMLSTSGVDVSGGMSTERGLGVLTYAARSPSDPAPVCSVPGNDACRALRSGSAVLVLRPVREVLLLVRVELETVDRIGTVDVLLVGDVLDLRILSLALMRHAFGYPSPACSCSAGLCRPIRSPRHPA